MKQYCSGAHCAPNNQKEAGIGTWRTLCAATKGISLIALIITIIVIIILAAIVIFTGLNTPDRANFAKFAQEISDFRLAIAQDFMNKKAEYTIAGKSRSDAQIYYIIASGQDNITNINEEPMPGSEQYNATEIKSLTGEDGLGLEGMDIKGTYAYQITDDKNVANWKKNTKYYEPTETHWVTDEGDVFILKGYRVEQNGSEKWYLNEKVASNRAITGPVTISVSNVRILESSTGNTEAGTDLPIDGSVTVYINFDASMTDGSSVTVSPSLPYPVTENNTYTFTITGGGKTQTKEVTVNNFHIPTIAETGYQVGDIVAYTAISGEYDMTNSDVQTGGTGTTHLATPENLTWRILSVSDSEVKITPGVVNAGTVTLKGAKGYFNGPAELHKICGALYSNPALGLTATNMTIEELNYAANNFQPETDFKESRVATYNTATRNVVFYPGNISNLSATTGHTATGDSNKVIKEGSETDSTITIIESGEEYTYTKKKHSSSSLYNFYTGNGIGERMWGGQANNSATGGYAALKPYSTTTEGETTYYPVFVRGTYYTYTPGGNSGRVKKLSEVLGTSNYGWLASPCVYVGSSDYNAGFRVRNAYGASVLDSRLARSSDSSASSDSGGLLPVVSLSTSHLTGTGTNNSSGATKGSATNPWGVK